MEKLELRNFKERINKFPWWLASIGLVIIVTLYLIINAPTFNEAFVIMSAGISTTITITLIAYGISLLIGLIVGLGRVSSGVIAKNLATFYVEIVRGIPMLVLIFFTALVVIPGAVRLISLIGEKFIEIGWTFLGEPLAGVNIRMVSMSFRAVVALSITYGAFTAEIFRAGIQSIHPGQMQAARSQGMSYGQAMRHVILPQAIRNMLPALGNDFISMLED